IRTVKRRRRNKDTDQTFRNQKSQKKSDRKHRDVGEKPAAYFHGLRRFKKFGERFVVADAVYGVTKNVANANDFNFRGKFAIGRNGVSDEYFFNRRFINARHRRA